jgi:hypothetical protein
MTHERYEKVVELVLAVPLFSKHIRNYGQHVGSQYFPPIRGWARYVEFDIDTRKNVFKKALNKFAKDNADIIVAALFVKNDDSCPSELRFYVNLNNDK